MSQEECNLPKVKWLCFALANGNKPFSNTFVFETNRGWFCFGFWLAILSQFSQKCLAKKETEIRLPKIEAVRIKSHTSLLSEWTQDRLLQKGTFFSR